jgi:DNA-binding NtrC family response regulator
VKKSKVLVVDDNTKILYAFQTFLENEGYISIPLEKGGEVLKILTEKKPKVVFLDIRLPDQDGLDILRQIKQKYPDLPVVIVSGHNNEENKNRARVLGATAFLEKPLSLAKMREILKKL